MASAAGRYASALFDLAKDQDAIDQTERDLSAFGNLLEESADLRQLVRSPVYSADDQQKALKGILDKGGVSGLTSNFLQLVARNRRLFAVEDMVRAFKTLAADARGEVRAEVTSAHPLSEEQAAALKEQLVASVGKDVNIDAHVDPALLGGLVVKLGSRMIDTSLRTQLNNLKFAMKEVR